MSFCRNPHDKEKTVLKHWPQVGVTFLILGGVYMLTTPIIGFVSFKFLHCIP
jgi:hypothetical protein